MTQGENGFLYFIGLLIGSAFTGALIGLIPLITGFVRKNKEDGFGGFLACIVVYAVLCILMVLGFDWPNIGSTIAFIITLVLAIYLAATQIKRPIENNESETKKEN